jgi:hypothetical protein
MQSNSQFVDPGKVKLTIRFVCVWHRLDEEPSIVDLALPFTFNPVPLCSGIANHISLASQLLLTWI